jgi:hypothetical protein
VNIEGKYSCQVIGANGDISILRVRKDNTILRENRDMYTLMVGRIMKLPRGKGTWRFEGTWLF